ncbi:MAG: hypothetical protein NVSMB32_04380 [Actinomycetota bacterium]
MELVVQYFEGCPNAELAVGRLRQALRRVGLEDVPTKLQQIESPEDAARLGFHGSPTVLIDGTDPFGDKSPPVGYACRLYDTEQGHEGAPSLAQLAAALEERGHVP